jgi:glycerol-3-phosphate responsive antiterminator
MQNLKTLVDLLKSKAKKTSEDEDLIEFVKGKYFFGVVKDQGDFEGITISRKFEAKYSKRTGFKIIDTIDEFSEKNLGKLIRYLKN